MPTLTKFIELDHRRPLWCTYRLALGDQMEAVRRVDSPNGIDKNATAEQLNGAAFWIDLIGGGSNKK